MRSLIPFLFVPMMACTSGSTAPASTAQTVRERLAQPTKLLVTGEVSPGSLTAAHYVSGGWQSGSIDVTVANGELDTSVNADGNLVVSGFALDFAPIDLPPSVFGKPATLRDVRLRLVGMPVAAAMWHDADDAAASVDVSLDLDWTIVVDGNAAPLGTQHLPQIPVALGLSGAGGEVDATIDVHATGDLWSWADLLKITELDLTLDASTAF